MRVVLAVCVLGLAAWQLGAHGKVLRHEEILRQLEETVINNDRKFLANCTDKIIAFVKVIIHHIYIFVLLLGVCLVEQESGGETRKVTNHENLVFSYGAFQINSTDGCGKGYTGGVCNIKCEGGRKMAVLV